MPGLYRRARRRKAHLAVYHLSLLASEGIEPLFRLKKSVLNLAKEEMEERKIKKEKEKEKEKQGEWAKEALRKRERSMAKGRIAP